MTSKVVEHGSNWDSEEKETCKGTERDRKQRTGEKEYDWQAKASMERRSDRKKTYRQFGPDEGKHDVGEDLRRQCKVYLSTYGMQVPWTGARHSKPVDTLHCDWGECEGARKEAPRVYTAFSDLSLYCPMSLGLTKTCGLVDCGAGINMGNLRFFQNAAKANGNDCIKILPARLTVRVADGKPWKLTQKALVTYIIAGIEHTTDFWLSADLNEDVLLGMPALRKMKTTLHIGETSNKDRLVMRDSDTEVKLRHYPYGWSTSNFPLQSLVNKIIPAGRAVGIRVAMRKKRAMEWPENMPLEGIVGKEDGITDKGMPLVGIVQLTNGDETTIVLKNHTDDDITIWAGDRVANLEPVITQTEQDEEGRPYLFKGADGALYTRTHYEYPHSTGQTMIYTGTPTETLPVAIRRIRGEHEQGQISTITEEELWDYVKVRHLREPLEDEKVADTENDIDAKVDRSIKDPGYTWEDVDINPMLAEADKALVVKLLKKHCMFFASIKQSYPNDKLPAWTNLNIKLKKGTMPWQARAYPLSDFKRKIMRQKIRAQLDAGMIRHSSSPFASPTFLVAKGKGGWRLVQDLRTLNSYIEKSSWPIPRIQEIIDRLKGASHFTSIDLADGFHQVGVEEESKKYTAFITEDGLYEANTVPMGMATSPNHFQYVMDRVLGGIGMPAGITQEGKAPGEDAQGTENLIGKDCFIYIDDVLIWSTSSLEVHLEKVDRVITRLSSFGLRAKSTKVKMAMHELKFLGHIISREGRRPCPEKVRAIEEIPIPSGRKAKTQVQALLGMAGWYRDYIEGFESIVAPLRELTAHGVDIDKVWGPRHQASLEAMKAAFKSSPIMAYPDFEMPFVVKTDSSKTHVGAILGQIQEARFKVIEYASKRLTKPQRGWHMTHLEGWAVVYALRKWKRYLEGRDGTRIVTDHKALLWLKNNKFSDSSGKLIRWFTFIDSFSPELQHRPGAEHGDVDGLTRCYEGEEDPEWEEEEQGVEWMFLILKDFLPRAVDTVQEVDYRAPKGERIFTKAGYGYERVAERDLKSFQSTDSTVVVALPPSKRDQIRNLLYHLRGKVGRWAIWAPLSLMQANYFREADVQAIIVKGEASHGATSTGKPVREHG